MPESRDITIDFLAEPPAPVRATMDTVKLEELAASIRRMGLLQPIVVVPLRAESAPGVGDANAPDGAAPTPGTARYEIVAGHRRFLAARMAGLRAVPCRVYESDEIAKEAVMLHENTCREDLSAAEEGWLFCEIAEREGITEMELCRLTGHDPGYIYPRMDLVRKDEEVAKANAQREINFAVAKAINKCEDQAHRRYLLQLAVQSGATARVVTGWVQQYNAQASEPQPPQQEGGAVIAPPPPPENVLKCFLCNQVHAPERLRSVFICYSEIEFVKRVAEKMQLAGEA